MEYVVALNIRQFEYYMRSEGKTTEQCRYVHREGLLRGITLGYDRRVVLLQGWWERADFPSMRDMLTIVGKGRGAAFIEGPGKHLVVRAPSERRSYAIRRFDDRGA